MALRTVLLAGATGLVGREILRGLLADAGVARVHVLGRRNPPGSDPRLTSHIVDFAALPPLPPAHELYLALGTTLKQAGGQAAFRALDYDANLNVAKAARAAGVTRAGLISAMGADPRARLFYSRVKGELERDLSALGFDGFVIARPSLLVGARAELGQSARPGEEWGFALDRAVGFLIPANYKPIPAADVAAALLAQVPRARGPQVIMSGQMRR